MNQSFLFFELIGVFIVHWLILEPQTYVVVEQFGAENIPLLSGRLVPFNPPVGCADRIVIFILIHILQIPKKTC